MILNNRQTAILYELTENKAYLSYEYFCNKFYATEKTIRTDIKKLNDFFNKDKIYIDLIKGKGFILRCSNKDRQSLMINFNYRYRDSSEIMSTYDNNDLNIYFLLSKGAIKIEKIASQLNTSCKSVSNKLKDIRQAMSKYNIELISKPTIGLNMVGNEINIRSLLIDQTSFMVSLSVDNLFYDSSSVFNIRQIELKDLSNIITSNVKDKKIKLSQISIIKLVVAIAISNQRITYGHHVSYDDKQRQLISRFAYYDSYRKIYMQINRYYGYEFNEDECNYFIMYAMLLLDYNEERFVKQFDKNNLELVKQYTNQLFDTLREYKIYNFDNYSRIYNALYGIVLQCCLRKQFNFIEYEFSNTFRVIAIQSSLCLSIGQILYDKLQQMFKIEFGEYILISLTLSLYDSIRYVTRTRKLCNIAIFSPYYKQICQSVVDRIEYHCSKFIRNIDVLTSEDIINKDLHKYDLILYFEDYEPIGIDPDIKHKKISFFVSNDDINNLYDELSVLSRSYKSSFGSLLVKDVVVEKHDISSVDKLNKYISSLLNGDSNLEMQFSIIKQCKILIYNNVLSFVLFTDNDELKKTKLVRLKKPLVVRGLKFDKILVNIINAEQSSASLKTAENLIRYMIMNVGDNMLAKDNGDIDLMQLFLYKKSNKLPD